MIFDTPAGRGHYGIILMDPPWQLMRGGKMKKKPNSSGISVPYKTMPTNEIQEYIRRIIEKSPEANLFVWCIQKYYIELDKMMKQLGFKKHTDIIWAKGNGPCPAFTIRMAHEYLQWWYKPGHIKMPINPGHHSSVITEPNSEHSKKPQAAYELIESMFPDLLKYEVFARKERIGWDAFGDELGGNAHGQCKEAK